MCRSSGVREGQTTDRTERELQRKNEHELSAKSRKETGKERQLRPREAPKVSNSVLRVRERRPGSEGAVRQ